MHAWPSNSTGHNIWPIAEPIAATGARTLLQENGYFVLRFLAEDVGRCLDTVLDTTLRVLHTAGAVEAMQRAVARRARSRIGHIPTDRQAAGAGTVIPATISQEPSVALRPAPQAKDGLGERSSVEQWVAPFGHP